MTFLSDLLTMLNFSNQFGKHTSDEAFLSRYDNNDILSISYNTEVFERSR
jgi:hypothetical protein